MTVCPHLTHEVWDDPVEDGPAVTEALLSRTQSPEVLRRSGHDVSEELHDDSPSILTIYGDVEEHHRVGLSWKRLGGRHLSGVGLQHAALAVGERLTEGLWDYGSCAWPREMIICRNKHMMKTLHCQY